MAAARERWKGATDSGSDGRPSVCVVLPSDLACWPVVKELLLELQGRLINESISDQETSCYMQVIYNTIRKEDAGPVRSDSVDSPTPKVPGKSVQAEIHRLRSQLLATAKKKPGSNNVWFGMLQYLKGVTKEEADAFLYNLLPRVIEMALGIEECRPDEGLRLSQQQAGGDTELSRQFVCSVVACFFLCIFPERGRDGKSRLNRINFTTFFKHLPLPSQVGKLQCILCYFESVVKRGMEVPGNIQLTRKSAGQDWLLTLEELTQCELRLCPVSAQHTGAIEDSGPDAIHVDFANRSIGGGALGRGRVQEEVRFCICPELLVVLLFAESLEPNEAFVVSGFEQFSRYTGYSESFCFAGPYSGSGELYSIVAIDAKSYKGKPVVSQYEESSVLRDLNKAVVGFSRIGKRFTPAPWVPWQEEPSNSAQDVAADMVTCAMTEAVSQAGEEARRSGTLSHHHGHQHQPLASPSEHGGLDLQSGSGLEPHQARSIEEEHFSSSCDRYLVPELSSSPHQAAASLAVMGLHPLSVHTERGDQSGSSCHSSSINATTSIALQSTPEDSMQSPLTPPLNFSPSPDCLSSLTDAASEGVSSLHHMNKDLHKTCSPSQLSPSFPSHATQSLPAADLPSASTARPLHSSPPSLVLRRAEEEHSHIVFESDSLGNLSKVYIDRSRTFPQAGILHEPGSESDRKAISFNQSEKEKCVEKSVCVDLEALTKDNDDIVAGSNVSISFPPDHATAPTAASSTHSHSSSSSSHHTGGCFESNIPPTTAEELKTKVSLSVVSPLRGKGSTSQTRNSDVSYSAQRPFFSPHSSMEGSLETDSSSFHKTVPDDPQSSLVYHSSLPVCLSLEGSNEDLFQQRSPTTSNIGDSWDDASSHGNTPRSLDITIPTVIPSLSGPSLERAGSGLSNLSMTVNMDSPTPSCASIDDDLGRMLYVSVDNEGECEAGAMEASRWDGTKVSPRQHKRLQSGLSPRSRLALQKQQQMLSSNPSPTAASHSPGSHHSITSHPVASCSLHHPADTQASDSSMFNMPQSNVVVVLEQQHQQPAIHSTATSTSTATTTTTTVSTSSSSCGDPIHRAPLSRQNSRDLYVELKEFLNSPNCSSRDSAGSWSGIHPPLSSTSTTSSFSSRSGSLSSHRGSNGFTGEFLEFWNHYRRRSSQYSTMSDASSNSTSSTSGTSRRSSSSHKHSTDFSTDLEVRTAQGDGPDISENLLKHSHGVIEEEGGGLVADFATHFVSVAVRNGVIAAASKQTEISSEATERGVDNSREEDKGIEDSPGISTNVSDVGGSKGSEDGSLMSESISSPSGGKAQVKSAIPIPSSSSKRQDLASTADFQGSPSMKSSEEDRGITGRPGKLKSKASAGESLQKSVSGKSSLAQTALSRRGLLGKAYPRSGTLVRQQSVSVHPEDEQQEMSKESHKPLEVSSVSTKAGEDGKVKSTGSENPEMPKVDGKDLYRAVDSSTAAQTQGFPEPVSSESNLPDISHRLVGRSSPPCPSADSGYLSLLSASGPADSDTTFVYSPLSTCAPSPSLPGESQHSEARPNASAWKRTEGEEYKDVVSAESGLSQHAQHSGATFSVKTKESGQQELYATLESKTIFLVAPPTHFSTSSEVKAAKEAKRAAAPNKPSPQEHKSPGTEANSRLKLKAVSERQAASATSSSHKVKSQGSAIPRMRTMSEPADSKSPSKDRSKLARGDSHPKKSESRQLKEKLKRAVRAVSEPCGTLMEKSSIVREDKSIEPEKKAKKPEGRGSKGDPKSKRVDSKPERVHKESTQRSKGGKTALSPTKQGQRYTSSRRLSNTSGEGADGSVSTSPVSAQPSSGASGPSKSSGIPKFKDSTRRSAGSTLVSGKTSGSQSRMPRPEVVASGKEKSDKERKRGQAVASHKPPSERHLRQEPLFKPHKSRYVFSDVAAPLSDKKSRKPREESSSKHKQESHQHRRHHHHHHHEVLRSSKDHEERRKLYKTEYDGKRRQRPKLSTGIRRFVNSLADRTVSEAVLEGADVLTQRSLISSLPSGELGEAEISEEVYSWFSNKIISQVFSHILQDLEIRDRQFQTSDDKLQVEGVEMSIQQLREIGASSGSPGEELTGRTLPSPVDASATDSMARSLSPLSVSCLTPSRATRAASPSSPNLKSPAASGGAGGESNVGTSHKRQGSLKMVKFQMGSGGRRGSNGRRGSDADAAETVLVPPPHSQPHPAASPVSPSSTSSLHVLSSPAGLFPIRPSSNIPIPGTRRRSSFDLASLSPPLSSMRAMGFSPPLRPTPYLASPRFVASAIERPGSSSAGLSEASEGSAKTVLPADLSVDVYQVAANIVDQVFQNISDSVREPRGGLTAHCTVSPGDEEEVYRGRRHYEGFVSNIFSSSSAASPSSSTATKTTTGTSSAKRATGHQQTRRSVSPSLGGLFSRQPMSRQVLTSAFLRVEGGGGWGPTLRTYQRRSSEPGQTSVQLSLQALNSIKFSTQAADEQARQRKVSRTDDDIGRHSSGRTWRRGSFDGGFTSSSSSSFEGRRRSSCGFKDPVLSRFAEELMKADTSVPELVIVGSHPSSTSTGSRRSSLSGFRDTTLANLESELLNTSFTSVNSAPLSTSNSPRASQRRHRKRRRHTTATTTTATASTCDSHFPSRPDLDRSHSRESAHSQVSGQWKSDSSDTEYWFPPPRLVGEEFRLEYERQHSQEELQDYASFFAGQVVQEAVCVLRQDPEFQDFGMIDPVRRDVDIFAENLSDQIMRDVFLSGLLLSDGADGDGVSGSEHRKSAKGVNSGGRGFSRASGKRFGRGAGKESHLRYYGEGARPKVRTPSQDEDPARKLHAQSPAKDIPPRKLARSRRTDGGDQLYDKDLLFGGGRGGFKRRTGGARLRHKEGQPHQHHLDIPSRSQRSHPSSSSSHQRKSSPSSLSPTAQAPKLSWSPVSPSSYLPVPVESGQPRPTLHSRPRSKPHTENIPSLAELDPSQLKEVRRSISRDYSPGSSSDTSSYGSDNTSSSMLSSSSEEDIGPQGLLFREEIERARRLSKRREQSVATRNREAIASWLAETKRESPHLADLDQERTPLLKSNSELSEESAPTDTGSLGKVVSGSSQERETSTQTRRSGETGQQRSPPLSGQEEEVERTVGLGVEAHWPGVEEFARELSHAVLAEAISDCCEGNWLRFLSYDRPIATGNWGCGSFRGDVQVKFVIQWLAASVARCPSLIYYTFGERALAEVKDLVTILSGQTVGELAQLLRAYCQTVCFHISSAVSSSLSFHPPPTVSSSSSLLADSTPEASKPPSSPQSSSFLLSSSPQPSSQTTPAKTFAVRSHSQQPHQQQESRQDEKQPSGHQSQLSSRARSGVTRSHEQQVPVSLFDFLLQQTQTG